MDFNYAQNPPSTPGISRGVQAGIWNPLEISLDPPLSSGKNLQQIDSFSEIDNLENFYKKNVKENYTTFANAPKKLIF